MENISTPLFPDLTPKLTDPLWFNVDKAVDDDAELTQLEQEHTDWVSTMQPDKVVNWNWHYDIDLFIKFSSLQLNSIAQKNCDVIPIGKTAAEVSHTIILAP